jgi:hypothetical protein
VRLLLRERGDANGLPLPQVNEVWKICMLYSHRRYRTQYDWQYQRENVPKIEKQTEQGACPRYKPPIQCTSRLIAIHLMPDPSTPGSTHSPPLSQHHDAYFTTSLNCSLSMTGMASRLIGESETPGVPHTYYSRSRRRTSGETPCLETVVESILRQRRTMTSFKLPSRPSM